MQSLKEFFGNSADRGKLTRRLIAGGAVVGAVVLVGVTMKLKASAPPRRTPVPVVVRLESSPPATPPSTPVQSLSPTPPTTQTFTAPDPESDQDPPAALTGLTITPDTAAPGDIVELKWTLSAPAPPGGAATVIGGTNADDADDAGQKVVAVPAGDTWQSADLKAPAAGSYTFSCSYAGVTYTATLKVVDNSADAPNDNTPVADGSSASASDDSSPEPYCQNLEADDPDDDTPCIDNEGDSGTYGGFKYERAQQQEFQEREQEKVQDDEDESRGDGN